MPTQQKFLGASIISYTGNIGWGYNPSTLNVTLVEDPVNLDDFSPVAVGTPIQFRHVSDAGYNWRFNGLVQNYKYNRGSSGFIYTVTLQDPRETLEGVQVILGGFAETVSVKNVLNVYGYLENIGFGYSERNSAGIPWKKVRDAITNMCNSTGNYGAGIYLRGNRYELDLSRLPNIDENFRVGGSDQLTLMDFISEVCEAGSHDYFVDLEDPTTNGFSGKIIIGTVSRNSNPTPGLLTNYLSTVSGVVSSEAGLEFRNDVVGKFLVGPPIISMYDKERIYDQNSGQTLAATAIKPFWGFDEKYEMLTGGITSTTSVFGNNHVVKLDSRHLRVPGLENYYLEIGELRAAYDSKASWISYIDLRKGTGPYSSANYLKPHEGKIKLITAEVFSVPSGVFGANPTTLQQLQKSWLDVCANGKTTDSKEKEGRVYNFVKSYADQYYGTKFAVQLPDIKITREPESLTYRTSKIPTDAGFFLPAQWSGAITQNKLPHSYTRLMTEDGRFHPYVRYDDISFLDFNEVPQSEMVFNSGRTSVFIKCGVENGVAFADIALSGEPHAVISLPGPVRKLGNDATDFGAQVKGVVQSGEAAGKFPAGTADRIVKRFGIDTIWEGNIGQAVMPNYVCIPLQDNENRYGPWWNIQANGRIEYETDDSLAPWNFGGYDLLDKVAFAKVSQMDSTMCEAESGSIEIAGSPELTMGQQLVSGGPYITDIQVSIGQDGVKTTYQFSTWSPRIQKLSKSKLDKIDRLAKVSRELSNRQISKTNKFENRTFSGLDRQLSMEKFLLRTVKDKSLGGSTSHGVLSADCDVAYVSGVTSSVRSNCWVQPFYNFAAQLDEDEYRGKAAVSIDGLFRPFSTHPSGVNYGLPSFVVPSVSGGDPTVNELNPYKGAHDISIVVRGSSTPDHMCTVYDSGYVNETDYRSLALRGPVVVAGWGFDSDGYPVPNSGYLTNGERNREFFPDYKQRQDLWPVGPIDLPWDSERGVWTGGGGSKAKIVRLIHSSGRPFPSGFNNVYYAQEMTPIMSGGPGTYVSISGVEKYMNVGNFRRNIAVLSGIYVAHKINGGYYIDNQLTFFGGIL